MNPQIKEEYAIVLDYLPNGYPLDTRPSHLKTPIAQAIGKDHFVLLELVPKKGVTLTIHDEVYMGEGKRDQVHHISGKVPIEKLTRTAHAELTIVIEELVKKHEKRFVEFFNRAFPINARRHQLELLPGIGKKHMWEVIENRDEKPFESFADIKKRLKLMPNPEKAIIKRILLELEGTEKHILFVGH
ncbi:DNA-binding protein [archaeon]|nr:DNA-binding protein [archaeon]|tara:strand:+ start:3449 stop:4009 length:561 start_codon:yes stop_codon:yes gene_type:complete